VCGVVTVGGGSDRESATMSRLLVVLLMLLGCSVFRRIHCLPTQCVLYSLPLIHTIRCATRCYFNVRSKSDMSWLNLPHGTNNEKSGKQKKKLRSKKRICSEMSVNSPTNPWSRSCRTEGRLRWEGFAEKEKRNYL